MPLGHETALKEISELNSVGKQILLIELFERNLIPYVELSNAYVSKLEKDNRQMKEELSRLVLQLCFAALSTSKDNGGTRKFIHEHYFHYIAGTPFAEQLIAEFGPVPIREAEPKTYNHE